MAAVKTRHRRAATRAVRLPDDRAVVGCALTAVAALLLMLLAGAAKAEQADLVCWTLPNGALECEGRASIEFTCTAIDDRHPLCLSVKETDSAAPRYLPGNTKYALVQLTRASLQTWHRHHLLLN